MENTNVKNATAGPHARGASDALMISVIAAGTENIALPNRNAEASMADMEVL